MKKIKITIENNNNIETKEIMAIKQSNKIIYKDEFKTIIDLKEMILIRQKENYKLELKFRKNECTKGKLIIGNQMLYLNIYTYEIISNNNILNVKYKIEDNIINLRINM